LRAIVTHAPTRDPARLHRQSASDLLRGLSDAGAGLPYLGGGKAIANRLRELRSTLRLCGWKLEVGKDAHGHTWFTLTKA